MNILWKQIILSYGHLNFLFYSFETMDLVIAVFRMFHLFSVILAVGVHHYYMDSSSLALYVIMTTSHGLHILFYPCCVPFYDCWLHYLAQVSLGTTLAYLVLNWYSCTLFFRIVLIIQILDAFFGRNYLGAVTSWPFIKAFQYATTKIKQHRNTHPESVMLEEVWIDKP